METCCGCQQKIGSDSLTRLGITTQEAFFKIRNAFSKSGSVKYSTRVVQPKGEETLKKFYIHVADKSKDEANIILAKIDAEFQIEPICSECE